MRTITQNSSEVSPPRKKAGKRRRTGTPTGTPTPAAPDPNYIPYWAHAAMDALRGFRAVYAEEPKCVRYLYGPDKRFLGAEWVSEDEQRVYTA